MNTAAMFKTGGSDNMEDGRAGIHKRRTREHPQESNAKMITAWRRMTIRCLVVIQHLTMGMIMGGLEMGAEYFLNKRMR